VCKGSKWCLTHFIEETRESSIEEYQLLVIRAILDVFLEELPWLPPTQKVNYKQI
jgi:hypothetical protein